MRLQQSFNSDAKERSGFTILEVLLAMGILVLGATSLIGILTFGVALTRSAQLRTSAASAMDAIQADLDQNLFPIVDGEAQDPVAIVDRSVPDAPGVIYSATPHINPENEREVRVDVEMSWQSAGVMKKKKFTALKLKELGFGESLRREFIEESGGFPPILGAKR